MAENLRKLTEKCKNFPKSEKCDHKRMELCALADLPQQNLASATQGILIDNASPILREEIKSPLSPFRYKDELEKALNDFHFGNMFTNGAQKVGGELKETILYISKTEEDIKSFLKYLQRKLEAEQKECTLDEKHDILIVPKYYDIVGKNIYGNRLGVGYGYCKYYCFSEAYDRNKYSNSENEKLKEILMHTREGAERISGLDILYMLGLV